MTGSVSAVKQRVEDGVGLGFLDLADNGAELGAAQRHILFARQRYAQCFQLGLDDEIGGAGEDIVGAEQVDALGAQVVDQIFDAGDDLLGGLSAGVDNVRG
jgi:hypothetical protein